MVWVPKNGGQEKHLDRVLGLVTDPRATQYWDSHGAVVGPFDEMLSLTGPCAGIFMLYGREARWTGAAPPAPDYWEDAHNKDLGRKGAPQFDAKRFANKALEFLN